MLFLGFLLFPSPPVVCNFQFRRLCSSRSHHSNTFLASNLTILSNNSTASASSITLESSHSIIFIIWLHHLFAHCQFRSAIACVHYDLSWIYGRVCRALAPMFAPPPLLALLVFPDARLFGIVAHKIFLPADFFCFVTKRLNPNVKIM